MKTVTVEEIIKFNPCYLKENGGTDESEKRFYDMAAMKKEWTALDVISLDIPPQDKLWLVLREEFIDAPILHEFACRCAEEALKLVKNPDPRSISAIETKRRWLRGVATDEELASAYDAASAAVSDAAWAAASAAARAAASDAAWAAASAAASDAASDAAWAAARAAASDAAWAAASDSQVDILREMLEGDAK